VRLKEKILLIDDMQEILIGLKILLSREGYEVSTAFGYYEATEEMERRAFDLVLTDYELEDKTGIDLLKEVRRRELNCPVILYTGTLNDSVEFEAKRMGAYEYLTKPVKLENLLGVIHMALHHKNKRVLQEVCTAGN
jgi:DNA-binding NtrC family response regulator